MIEYDMLGASATIAAIKDVPFALSEMGATMSDTWPSNKNWETNVAKSRTHVGKLCFDTALAFTGSAVGARFGSPILFSSTLTESPLRLNLQFQPMSSSTPTRITESPVQADLDSHFLWNFRKGSLQIYGH
jgi:hypothetical protein